MVLQQITRWHIYSLVCKENKILRQNNMSDHTNSEKLD